jgi:hypothetical protein
MLTSLYTPRTCGCMLCFGYRHGSHLQPAAAELNIMQLWSACLTVLLTPRLVTLCF